MSIASEITRLQNAKSALKTSINAKTDSSHQIDDETLDEYSDFVDSIQTGGGGIVEPEEKDVNLYDYDGTRLYSYTKEDFLALNSLPENPTHTGLTAKGWNWSLSDAKTYVTNNNELDIGQMYITDDGTTRIYISLQEGRLSPYLGFGISGTATIDWGDNSTSTVTGTSIYTTISTQHNYVSSGEYVISISSESKIYFKGSSSYGSFVLWSNSSTSTAPNRIYQNAIYKVELNKVELSNYAFDSCNNLQEVILSNNISNRIYGYAFRNMYGLKALIIPNNVTRIDNYCFSNTVSLKKICLPKNLATLDLQSFEKNYSLQKIILPTSITNVYDYMFWYCYNLRKIILHDNITSLGSYAFGWCATVAIFKLPSKLNSISSNAFSSCFGVAYFDFTKSISVPSLSNSNAFPSTSYDIVVPDSLYDTWIAATNWSSLASKIIKESDFNA